MLRSKSVSSIGTLIVCDRPLSHFALDKTVTRQVASVIDWVRVQGCGRQSLALGAWFRTSNVKLDANWDFTQVFSEYLAST